MDYESPPANRVARDIWSALSRKTLNAGFAGITARWESLQEQQVIPRSEGSSICIFVLGQDRPESVKYIGPFADRAPPLPYGVVVATPESPNPLAGSLLYQGVGRLTDRGVKAGAVLPALIPVSPKTEGEAYATRLFQVMQNTRDRR